MVEVVVETPMVLASPLVLDFKAIEMTDDQFVQFCADNDDLRIELTAKRELIVMPPTNLETGSENLSLSAQLYNWTRQDGSGIGFDSSSMFTLPNGAVRSLDASWMLRERWVALPLEERRRFSHIVPDFVAELRSPSDRLSYVQLKMEEYMENGARLGWLIDPFQRRVYVYRPGQPVEVLENPARVSGEDVLPGFELNPQEIREPL
jgi:Uma2 family endonuclease